MAIIAKCTFERWLAGNKLEKLREMAACTHQRNANGTEAQMVGMGAKALRLDRLRVASKTTHLNLTETDLTSLSYR
jgi:hypothetical protein